MITLKRLTILAVSAVLLNLNIAVAEESSTYNIPNITRGFALEHGTTAEKGKMSIDLATGRYDTEGGIRIGLDGTELMLNTGLSGEEYNEIAFKAGFTPIESSYGEWHIATIGGLSYYSVEDQDSKGAYSLAAAFTLDKGDSIFTINPGATLLDTGADTETVFSIGLGAYMTMAENEYGRFQPGAEVFYDDFSEELQYDLGIRWSLNTAATIDFVFAHKSASSPNQSTTVTEVPGIIRFTYSLQ